MGAHRNWESISDSGVARRKLGSQGFHIVLTKKRERDEYRRFKANRILCGSSSF